jgi:hypothetical protein
MFINHKYQTKVVCLGSPDKSELCWHSQEPDMLHSKVGSSLNKQTSDYVGEACQEQTL